MNILNRWGKIGRFGIFQKNTGLSPQKGNIFYKKLIILKKLFSLRNPTRHRLVRQGDALTN